MRIFRFDEGVGKDITQFGSRGAKASPLMVTPGRAQIICFHLSAGGVIGEHPAAVDQLLAVVQGDGWVRGGEGEKLAISAGQAAFWRAEEIHETGTEVGMVAIVIEGEGLQPEKLMQGANSE